MQSTTQSNLQDGFVPSSKYLNAITTTKLVEPIEPVTVTTQTPHLEENQAIGFILVDILHLCIITKTFETMSFELLFYQIRRVI